MADSSKYLTLGVASSIFKLVIMKLVGTSLNKFAHFNTPLSSLNGVKEAIVQQKQSGLYYNDPNGVAQSLYTIKVMDFIM